jgi:hypothetical protein
MTSRTVVFGKIGLMKMVSSNVTLPLGGAAAVGQHGWDSRTAEGGQVRLTIEHRPRTIQSITIYSRVKVQALPDGPNTVEHGVVHVE